MVKKSDLKIVVLPSFYPMEYHYTRGGFFEEQTQLIKKEGVTISVVFNENRSILSFSLKKLKHIHFQTQHRVENGIPVYRKLFWNIVPTKFELGRIIWIKTSINLVKSYIKKYGKPNLFHVHCAFDAGIVAEYFKRNYNIPYVITEHSSFFALSQTSNYKKKQALRVYNNAEKIIAVSNPLKKMLSEKIGIDLKKITIIPNFIDTDYFNPNDSTLKNDIKEKIIFTVCHHNQNKRLDRLIDAFAIVLQTYPDWKLVIGGEGSETKRLKERVCNLHLSEHVIFKGFLNKESVRANMNKAKVFVSSSDIETFGVVIIEAMAMGLPVVSTASGGPEDIIIPETGVIVEKNVSSLANGLIQLITNYNIYDKNFIRLYIENNFSGKKIAQKYKIIYEDSALKY